MQYDNCVAIKRNFSQETSLNISASNITSEGLSRKQRQLFFNIPNQPVRASWAGGEGYACITSRGILGSCQSFRNCYPFFKFPPPGVRFPILTAGDTWVLGNYDTCSYHTFDGRQANGVCCTNPITPSAPTVGSDENEQNKIGSPPTQTVPQFGQWPPPLPTHPPNHAAPTHPPSLFGIQPATTTERPTEQTSTTRASTTTWATRPPFGLPTQPIFAAPAQTTTKRPFFIPTESPSINDVAFDIGSCGAKNGFQVIKQIIEIRSTSRKIFLGSRKNCWRSKCWSEWVALDCGFVQWRQTVLRRFAHRWHSRKMTIRHESLSDILISFFCL